MPIVLDGTAGIDNDATDLSYTGTLTGGTGVVNLGSGQLVKDSSGNLGLGVTPSAWNGAWKALEVGFAGNAFTSNSGNASGITSNAVLTSTGWKYGVNGSANFLAVGNAGGSYAFYTAPSGTAGNAISFTQAMTLDASGRLLIGLTSDPAGYGGKLSISGGGHCVYVQTTAAAGYACMTLARAGASSGDQLYFVTTSGLAGIVSSSGTTTNYGTGSDYRLKEDVQPMSGALAKVAQLKPVTYKWKADGSDGEGFIAHELQEIFPGAVVGKKDAVDEKGNIKPQNIDTSFLVATLTAAIQELKAEFDAYKATHP